MTISKIDDIKSMRMGGPLVLILFAAFLQISFLQTQAAAEARATCRTACPVNIEVVSDFYGASDDEIIAIVDSALACHKESASPSHKFPISLNVYVSSSPPPQARGYISMTLYRNGSIIDRQWKTLSALAQASPHLLKGDIRGLVKKLPWSTVGNCVP